jgi:hypothetical protein
MVVEKEKVQVVGLQCHLEESLLKLVKQTFKKIEKQDKYFCQKTNNFKFLYKKVCFIYQQ